MPSKSIKLLVCYHKPDVLLKDDIFVPIHVGRELALMRKSKDDESLKWLLENTIGDNTGENISAKNDSYNELTALYWAWKNYDKLGAPDYIGLMHYRRHFIFRPSDNVVEECEGIDENYFDYINYNKETMSHLFDDCDYVAHIGKVDNIYKHYLENHHIEDLNLAIKILEQKYPQYSKTARKYLNMSYGNFCNMFILPKHLFFGYCKWIFDILEAFENQTDLSEKRLFISERLTGIYIEQLRRDGYKQKALSATFIKSTAHISVAIPYKQNLVFSTAVMMKSILQNASKESIVDFNVLYENKDVIDKNIFNDVLKYNQNYLIKFINVTQCLLEKGRDISIYEFPEHYPIVVSEVLDKVNKVLYLDENALFFGEIGDFYRACNNDEFWVLGLSNCESNVNKKVIDGNAFSINCARVRKHKLLDAIGNCCIGKTACEIFEEFCGKELSCFPWWTYNISDKNLELASYNDNRYISHCYDVLYRPMLYYKRGVEPWKNVQALHSIFWWQNAATIPASVPIDCISNDVDEIMASKFEPICNLMKSNAKKRFNASYNNLLKRKDLIYKGLKYLKLHGVKATVKKCFEKLRGGKKRG